MCAVLEYSNRNGMNKERVWNSDNTRKFSALIKCYVQFDGDYHLRVIEKPSKRPATFNECYRFAQKLKAEYGVNLKQMIIWDLDKLKGSSTGFSNK
jgi:hypothetical protein